MGRKMKNAPIYYILAQARFNPILSLDQHIPKIQDELRQAGYPDFSKEALAAIQFNVSSGGELGQITPTAQPVVRYQFFNSDRNAGFILEQNGISFQMTNYDIFESFLESFLIGVNIIHNSAKLAYSDRIGIRCLDAVCPKVDEKISAYLTPSVLGLFDQLAPRKLAQAISETMTKLENTTLVSRVIIINQERTGAISFPPDLQTPLQIGEKFKNVSGVYAIIDTDAWLQERKKFDTVDINVVLKEVLAALHK